MSSRCEPGQTWQRTRDVMVKILAAVYLGGAYGLILISLVQAYVLVTWLRQ